MAVKLVNKKKVAKDGKAGIEGLKVEIAVQKYIKHPQLVGLYDYFEDAKYHYLIMEHIDGGEVGFGNSDIDSLLPPTPLPSNSLDILQTLCSKS